MSFRRVQVIWDGRVEEAGKINDRNWGQISPVMVKPVNFTTALIVWFHTAFAG